MKLRIFILFLFIWFAFSDDCLSGTLQLIVKKVSTSKSDEESWSILSTSGTVYYTSSSISNNQTTISMLCIPQEGNLNYILRLEDKNDMWSFGAYIVLYGEHDKYILKTTLMTLYSNDISFHLNDIIYSTTYWYYAHGTVDDNWYSIIDSSFITHNPTDFITSYGTQYFRQQFTVNTENFKEFEFCFYYKEGIRIYINGEIIFNDHLPTGSITSSTVATGEYQSYVYKTISLAASLFYNGNNIIAYEIHHTKLDSITIKTFNYLYAIYNENIDVLYSIDKCVQRDEFEEVTVTPSSASVFPVENIINNNPFQYWKATKGTSSIYVKIIFSKYVMISAYQIVCGGYNTSSYITSWKLWGITSSQHSVVIDQRTNQKTGFMKRGDHHYYYVQTNTLYKEYYLELLDNSNSDYFTIGSVYFYTCNKPVLSTFDYITMKENHIIGIDTVYYEPMLQYYTDCILSEDLPSGLLFTSFGGIYGQFETSFEKHNYTISCLSHSITKTISLQGTICMNSFLTITKTYSQLSTSDSYSIYDTETKELLFESLSLFYYTEYFIEVNSFCWTMNTIDIILKNDLDNVWSESSLLTVTQSFPAITPTPNPSLLLSVSYDSLYNSRYTINLHYLIPKAYSWFYLFSYIPLEWYADLLDVTNWNQASLGHYPSSLSQLQLYRNTFTIEQATLIGNLELQLRYIYACDVYINGIEVFRDKLESNIDYTSYSSSVYDKLQYYTIIIPSLYLRNYVNTIAIYIVDSFTSTRESLFDASLRLLYDNHFPSNSYFSIDCQNTTTSTCMHAFDMNHITSLVSEESPNLSIYLKPIDFRYNYINEYSITTSNNPLCYLTSWYFYGRESNTKPWILLHSVVSLSYIAAYTINKYSLYHIHTQYNEYLFTGFLNNDITNSTFILPDIQLYSSVLYTPKSPLSYGRNTKIDAYYLEVFPTLSPVEEGFYNFKVIPDLPLGLSISSETGIISGIAKERISITHYNVTATSVDGNLSFCSLFITISKCLSPKHMIFIKINTDTQASEMSYILLLRTSNNHLKPTYSYIDSQSNFKQSTSYVFAYCLTNSIYVLSLYDSQGDGWGTASGYQIETYNNFIIHSGTVPVQSKETPYNVTFSTNIVIENNVTPLYVHNTTTLLDSKWNTVSLLSEPDWIYTISDTSYWLPCNITHYFSYILDLSLYTSYTAINGFIQMTGGASIYINGYNIALINLPSTYTWNTTCLKTLSYSTKTYFSIPIQFIPLFTSYNIISIEIHEPDGIIEDLYTNEYSNVQMEFSLIFLYGTCVSLMNTMTPMASSTLLSGTVSNIFDNSYFTSSTLLMNSETNNYIQLQVANKKGLFFNSLGIQRQGLFSVPTLISIYGNYGSYFDVITYLDNYQISWDSSLEGFNQFKTIPISRALYGVENITFLFKESSSSNSIILPSLVFEYCTLEEPICKGDSYFGPIGNYQYSYGSCPDNYEGFTKRYCMEGSLFDIDYSDCKDKSINNFMYESSRMTLVKDIYISSILPTYTGTVRQFTYYGLLPSGLFFNNSTGAITGIPNEITNYQQILIMATNNKYSVSYSFEIQVREGICDEDDIWSRTAVNSLQILSCSSQGSFIGSLSRYCLLGNKDGEWSDITGTCVSAWQLILYAALIGIAILLSILLFIILKRKFDKKHKIVKHSTNSTKQKYKPKRIVKQGYSYTFSLKLQQSKQQQKGSVGYSNNYNID